jgi:alpha-mannosidase
MTEELELLETKLDRKLQHIEATRFTAAVPIEGWRMKAAPRFLDAGLPTPDDSWRAIAPGETWRPEAEATWFLATVTVPEGWSGGPVIANIELGGESQVFINGALTQSINRGRSEIRLADTAQPGARFELALETARQWTLYRAVRPESFDYADLVIPNAPVREFMIWARLVLQAAFTMQQGSTARRRMVRLLDNVVKGIEFRRFGTEVHHAQLRRGVEQLQAGLPKIGPGGPGDITLVGHAHIDTAWLWPLSETKRKCGRTFSNVLRLMERYPQFRFSQSQPQLYQYTKQLFPDLYAQIKERIAEGRWEPMGGAWVECDCNVSGGEALIRQLLYGKRFFRQEFGQDTTVGWWPDAFGYSWSMPQILKHCGMEHFFSTKISWNQFNTFPCGLFWWQGIDGTKLLSFHATGTYNGNVTPGQLAEFWRNFPERDRVDHYLHSFGFGDGGGGPTAGMIERGTRLTDMPGVPQCHFGRTDEFFAVATTETAQIPTWNDELYLELHRGVQTTQARTKRGNRKVELALREAEILNSVAHVAAGAPYPGTELQDMWERLLCYQFHDILPGSSIHQVYAEAEADYTVMLAEAARLRDAAIAAGLPGFDTQGEGQAVVVFNTVSCPRSDVVEVTLPLAGDDFHAVSPTGQVSPCQVVARDGSSVTLLFAVTDFPALGHAVYHIRPGRVEATAALTVSDLAVDTEALRAEFDRGGRLVRLWDKCAAREVLAPGEKANLLQLFDDRPYEWDAWEIDPWFEDQQWEVPDADSVEVVETGPVRVTLRFHRRTEKSSFVQEVRLYAHSRRIDFVTHADWHEQHVMLKAAFPVDVLATQASYEIQFGAITRPTHNNTMWDRAKFEVPAHRWADLSETGYGVALLNDCKYGYDVKGNVLRLSLLRATSDPDPQADQGEHDFTYALYPHLGGWREGEVVSRGLELNVPLLAVPAASHPGPMPAQGSLAVCDRPNVVVETLKKSEDGDDLILRLYESQGARGPVSVSISLPVQSVVECNGMEEEIGAADWQDGVLRLEIKPWQIRSFRLRR